MHALAINMKKNFAISIVLLLACLVCSQNAIAEDCKHEGCRMNVVVTNNSLQDLSDVPVVISLKDCPDITCAVVEGSQAEAIPCQLDDLDKDGRNDELCFLVNVPARSATTVNVTLYNIIMCKSCLEKQHSIYPDRTYAEMVLRNPKVKEKNRHDIYLTELTADSRAGDTYTVQHHHGVAFENELITLRIYFDKRQTLDLYGKYHQGLELRETQFYTSEEQKKAGYGDDVLWVGNSFGLGALRGWDGEKPTMVEHVATRTQRILCQGPVRTIVEVEDRGWRQTQQDGTCSSNPINMTLRYTLYAGHRDIEVEARFNKPADKELFSTGIINVNGSEEFSDHEGLRGCWGTDWPASDTINWKRETVGLGIYVPVECCYRELDADKQNYGFIVKTDERSNTLRYHIAYTSANEDFGPQGKDAWFQWLRLWKDRLLTPVKVETKNFD